MISLFVVCWLLLIHWVADFICQTHYQATNKSSNLAALTEHIFVYTLILLLFAGPLFANYGLWPIVWALFNGGAHWVTDFFTSRATKKLWLKKDVHNFFVVIGFDQLVHYVTLFGSTVILFT